MKFNCDYFKDLRKKRVDEAFEKVIKWHKIFAWTPIKLGHGDCRWLEFVERRYSPTFTDERWWFEKGYDFWEYRSVK